MAARKPKLDVCFFCDESPCVCNKAKKPTPNPSVKAAPSRTAPVSTDPEPVFVESKTRTVRKITAPPPVGQTFVQPTRPVPIEDVLGKRDEPVKTVVKKIERNLSVEEILEIRAVQTLVECGLVAVKDNPNILPLVEVRLTPQERTRAWKAML